MKKRRYSIARPKARFKRKPAAARCNPDAKVVLNKQGGIVPASTFDLVKARTADLGTLPKGLCGTRCDSRKFYVKKSPHTGWCKHALVMQLVSDRQCCIHWDRAGWLRPKKAVEL